MSAEDSRKPPRPYSDGPVMPPAPPAADRQAMPFPQEEVERQPRVKLLPLHDVEFVLETPQGFSPPVQLANLSATGMGLIRTAALGVTVANSTIVGQVRLREGGTASPKVFRVRGVVVHLKPSMVGVRFTELPVEFRATIGKFFRLELQAVRMREVNPEILRRDDEGEGRLFVGGEQCEFFFVKRGERLVHFYLSFYDCYLEGRDGRIICGGTLLDDPNDPTPPYKRATVIQLSQGISPQVIEDAVRFVENIDKAPPELRAQVAAIIQSWEP